MQLYDIHNVFLILEFRLLYPRSITQGGKNWKVDYGVAGWFFNVSTDGEGWEVAITFLNFIIFVQLLVR